MQTCQFPALRFIYLMAIAAALSACATAPQSDGSTQVRITPSAIFKKNDAPQAVMEKHAAAKNEAPVSKPQAVASSDLGTPIAKTPLAGLFGKFPFDGTAKTYFPRVAVTVTDWSNPNCWIGSAVIWRTKLKSEPVPEFTVCWKKSLGFALNNAANLHLFMEQSAVEHSGNVRGIGPKPPMIAVPDHPPLSERALQEDWIGFIQQLVLETGWKPGAPTNMWVVDFKKK